MAFQNRIGHCTACDKPIATIIRWHENTGHPEVDATPCQIGEWDDDAYHVTVLLIRGQHVELDMCGPCAKSADERLSAIWHRIRYGQGKILDPEWCKAKGQLPLTPNQEHKIRITLSEFATNPPLGIFSRRRWGDIKNDRAASVA